MTTVEPNEERYDDALHLAVAAFVEHRNRLKQIIDFRLNPRLQGRLDAEDVLQEAWIATSQRIHHLDPENSYPVFVWLRMIVLQTLTDMERRHLGTKKRDAYREKLAETNGAFRSTTISLMSILESPKSTPSKAVIRAERKQQLLMAIEEMEPIDREVLALRHFEELSNTETASVLDIQETAASNRYVRAIRRLKMFLDQRSDFKA